MSSQTNEFCPHDGTRMVLNGINVVFGEADITCGKCGYTKTVRHGRKSLEEIILDIQSSEGHQN